MRNFITGAFTNLASIIIGVAIGILIMVVFAFFFPPKAHAADMAAKKATPQTAPIYFGPWAGWYGGVQVGYGYDVSGLDVGGLTLGNAPQGITGGGRLGYDWNTGNFVIGVVTEANVADFNSTGGVNGFSWSGRTNWWGDTDVRLGLPIFGNHVLPYGAAGIAYGGRTSNVAPITVSDTSFGWNAGAGLEAKITPTTSVFAEAKYIDLGTLTVPGFATQAYRFGVIQGGVNFHW